MITENPMQIPTCTNTHYSPGNETPTHSYTNFKYFLLVHIVSQPETVLVARSCI